MNERDVEAWWKQEGEAYWRERFEFWLLNVEDSVSAIHRTAQDVAEKYHDWQQHLCNANQVTAQG